MTFEGLSDVNWPAIVVAALAYFVLGAIWYMPKPMAAMWMRSGGIEVTDDNPNPMVFLGSLVCYFVAGIATALLAVATGTDSAAEGLVLGLIIGVGFAFTAAAVSAIYDRKPEPLTWFLFNGIYNVLGLILVAVIISIWR